MGAVPKDLSGVDTRVLWLALVAFYTTRVHMYMCVMDLQMGTNIS